VIDLSRVARYARQIDLRLNRSGAALMAGPHRSVFRGQGLTFVEHREFQFGDDVRHVDWNVTARRGRPFVKVFEEDRASGLLLVVDTSASMAVGTRAGNRRGLAAELAALFVVLAMRRGDRIGLLQFGAGIDAAIPLAAGRAHAEAILRALDTDKISPGQTNVAMACERVRGILRRRGLVVLVSDFLARGYGPSLRALSARHEVIALAVVDPLEANLPDAGLLRIADVETDALRWVDSGSRKAREAYAEKWQEAQRARRRLFADYGISHAEIVVGRPYLGALLNVCRLRRLERRTDVVNC
jgi:uncharacterized protein (DUF58 family)